MDNNQSFGKFMTDVMNRADKLSFEKRGHPLSDKYEAPTPILKMIGSITDTGWESFISMYSQLISRGSYFLFAGALGPWITSALGVLVSSSLMYWGGQESIKLLYSNKGIVEAVKRIGDRYRSYFDNCSSDEDKDNLANRAANDLYNL